jgi:Calx-beta domain
MGEHRRTVQTRSLGGVVASTVLVGLIASILPLTLAAPAFASRVKTITVTDASVVEGDSGSTSLTFTISWTGAKGGAVSVSYATADISATAGSDYTAKSGTLALPNGSCKCQTVSIPVLGDATYENTETFAINLSNPVNATIADGLGVGTIYDNEGPPAFVVGDASADEGAGTLSFLVTMTSAAGGSQTVDYATADGTAVAGSDYTATSGSLTFTGGQTSKTVDVPVTNDTLNEADETLSLIIGNGSVAITDETGAGTITNDDAEPTVTASAATAAENAGPLSFTISLSTASGQEVDVDYTTTDGTAIAGADYTLTSGTAVIPAGQTSVQVDVALLDDTTHESDETLTLDLSSPYNAGIVDPSGTGTITNDDALPEVSIGDTSVAEGDLGLTSATFDVTLNHASDAPVTVNWATAEGTAIGSDYVSAGSIVSFAAGETTQQVSVDVVGDLLKEADETFTVALSSPNGATLGTDTGTATITDDDRTATALTLKVRKAKTKVSAKGYLEPAVASAPVSVSLLKQKGTTWVVVTTRITTVGAVGDHDADGLPDAVYHVGFKRPSKGTYRVRSTFAGTLDLMSCSKTVTFTL